jgi:hypothetical protein
MIDAKSIGGINKKKKGKLSIVRRKNKCFIELLAKKMQWLIYREPSLISTE